MNGTKAMALESYCRSNGRTYTRSSNSCGIKPWRVEMLLVAMEIPHRIQGLVGIATATDFIKRRFECLPEETKDMIKKTRKWEFPTPYNEKPYILSWNLIQEAQQHELNGSIPVNCPVRLIHGMNDEEVPYDISIDVAQRLQTNDVKVTLIKDGSHRLSEPKHIRVITRTIEHLIQDLSKPASNI
ncbi:hypothetical protein QZH41_010625 [Actinostola sp. cb2023]|nr:hypothetical protein QZH41_010625 [Actinostola sp. cb2023]